MRTLVEKQILERRRVAVLADRAVGLLDAEAPDYWTDANGRAWQTPRTKNALSWQSGGQRALKDFIYQRDHHRCVLCGSKLWLHVDHIISRRCGGAHHPDNLRTLCNPCNSMKAALVDSRREAVA